MLTSKLILMSCTWAMAFLVSIALRITGILHPEHFYVNHFFVWFLVFGPSFLLLTYFLIKRASSFDWLT
tara:strand:- start:815 stop:1021 length:207 start_codon:yes stop_codon:yes gene_type:complete